MKEQYPNISPVPEFIEHDEVLKEAHNRGVARGNHYTMHPELHAIPSQAPMHDAGNFPDITPARQVPQDFVELKSKLHANAPNATRPYPLSQRDIINKAQMERLKAEGLQ